MGEGSKPLLPLNSSGDKAKSDSSSNVTTLPVSSAILPTTLPPPPKLLAPSIFKPDRSKSKEHVRSFFNFLFWSESLPTPDISESRARGAAVARRFTGFFIVSWDDVLVRDGFLLVSYRNNAYSRIKMELVDDDDDDNGSSATINITAGGYHSKSY